MKEFWASHIIRAAKAGDLERVDIYAEHWAQHCDREGDEAGAKMLRKAISGERGPMFHLCEASSTPTTPEPAPVCPDCHGEGDAFEPSGWGKCASCGASYKAVPAAPVLPSQTVTPLNRPAGPRNGVFTPEEAAAMEQAIREDEEALRAAVEADNAAAAQEAAEVQAMFDAPVMPQMPDGMEWRENGRNFELLDNKGNKRGRAFRVWGNGYCSVAFPVGYFDEEGRAIRRPADTVSCWHTKPLSEAQSDVVAAVARLDGGGE